ncbi:hypothetical protein OS965_38825 [Streptomyces sp. H27-G5]|uniref:hypothetical protein n=1 Tax=Streptomyces sp. H27-G5 TaxID=2996698 RepID=UPI0022704F8E|nr:hypothetical protein [Streptomyces sp. H27-G5]MCY0924012.1 hypothetical protein [Streptomyces sp. H27-G5]
MASAAAREPNRQVYEDLREVLVTVLRTKHGITTSRFHGRPHREPCHLVHQDDLERRRPGRKLPRCHPNFGKSERDFEMPYRECALSRDMPPAVQAGVDHTDAWWREDRMVAWAWYPYTVPLDTLGEAHARAGKHGLSLSLATGWGAHFYGSTPAVILGSAEFTVPDPPLIQDVVKAARKLPHRAAW